jgi:hypothetical protein
MLNNDQAQALWVRLNDLKCVSPEFGNDLFTYVFLKEPPRLRPQYESHLPKCEHCQIALELYRYQRDSGNVLVEYLELGKKIIEEARAENTTIETKALSSGMAYFRPAKQGGLGLTVVVNSDGEISLVEEQSREDFGRVGHTRGLI